MYTTDLHTCFLTIHKTGGGGGRGAAGGYILYGSTDVPLEYPPFFRFLYINRSRFHL